MEYIESFFLNLIPGGSTPACHVSQYDKGRTIRANLIKGSTAYSIKNGDVFTLNIKKPDGNIVTSTVEATEGNTYIDFSTTEQMCAVKGNNICEFSIKNNADLIGTANFLMIVEASPLEGGIESKSEIENLTTQIEEIVEDVVPEVLSDDYYDKEQSDERYANKTQVYSKAEIDTDLKTTESHEVEETINPTWTAGYVGANGVVHDSTSYHYSSRISVSEGEKIYFYSANDITIGQYRFLTAYKNNAVVESKGGQNIAAPYTVPSDVDEIVVSLTNMSNVSYGKKIHSESELVPALKPDVDALLLVSANAKDNSLFYEFDYTAGTTFSGTENLEDICAYRVCFFAKIGSVTGEAKIGKGIGFDYGGGIGFDGTNLYLYLGSNQNPQATKAHGLTLKDYVAITIDSKYTATATVTISTNGGRYEWNPSVWRSNYGKLTFTAPDNYTECKMSYTCEGLTKETWLYGDSYFSNSDNARWTKYLVLSGHTNYLLNAYGGRTSVAALASLKVDLSMNRAPRRIVWCLGMNDKDGASTPNQGWQNCVEEVKAICEKLHIELVLATIPNVPHQNTDNTKKNAYVINSGYRYIDFAKAVSLNGDSTWYDNMLYSDNLHPDVQGAIALYGQAVATVPELLF